MFPDRTATAMPVCWVKAAAISFIPANCRTGGAISGFVSAALALGGEKAKKHLTP